MDQYYKLQSNIYFDYTLVHKSGLSSQIVLPEEEGEGALLSPLIYEMDCPDCENLPHFLTGETVLASEKFISLLKSMGIDNIRTFPVHVIHRHSNREWRDYHLFNITSPWEEFLRSGGTVTMENILDYQRSE
ncbi:MAG: hypothetical protein PQJ60_08355, partial [Spirochaetales bacterium]|nr:hypothetical protein [Spirochaetales bacterium]